MQVEKLGLHHRDILVPRLKSAGSALSEYTFANLYLFRGNHDYEVITDREIFIRGTSYDGRRYLMPTVDVRTLDLQYLRELDAGIEFLFPIPDAWLSAFDEGSFDISYAGGDADYLYTVEKMSTLGGRRLHKKRNLLKQFVATYRHDARPLTNDKLGDARVVLEDWLKTTEMDVDDTDYGPCREALDRYEDLVLCGGIYYAEDEPAGFVLGEELGADTFVLHFAKARTKFKGIYQYMFNTFARVLPPKYKYLNLEQDLEKENLRVFKGSYVPDAMLRKARVGVKR